ncbi:MAG: hypothetical protein F4Y27_04725 [Acidimicrobiaceae bacterium]|nr:hypothetical protein [Acidimicrobiaceae bacterium]MYA73960.1 hypothetical protein [Acidimicrobiaceae bacterium]MYD06766.1 hypothetical protein [Acidimicrobiaceae bacterium]MYG54101.1 hypothetical protein [Acidimicrobiaceae bacterium]MYJ97417.1 hypothetical protein [Acidimicrobiaceae bacterium]
MEPTVIATIIGVMGTGLLGMFGYFIHSVRGDIRDVRGDVKALDDKFDKRLGTLEVTVAAMAATLEHHSMLLHHMMGFGERIPAPQGSVFGRRAEGAVSGASGQEPGGAEPTTANGPSTTEPQDPA